MRWHLGWQVVLDSGAREAWGSSRGSHLEACAPRLHRVDPAAARHPRRVERAAAAAAAAAVATRATKAIGQLIDVMRW